MAGRHRSPHRSEHKTAATARGAPPATLPGRRAPGKRGRHARLVSGQPGNRVEPMLERPSDPDRLNGCGLIVVNPPYTLEGELAAVLPELSRRMASARGGAGYRLDWIGPTRASPEEPASEAKRRMRTRR